MQGERQSVRLGERQKEAAAELAQWWDGVRHGGVGSHVVLLVGPEGWGRSTVLGQLPDIISSANAPICSLVRVNGRSLPNGHGPQALGLRDGLLGADVRWQAAALLCRGRLRGAPRLGIGSLLLSGIAGTVSLLLASLAAAAKGSLADDSPASENGVAARAAQVDRSDHEDLAVVLVDQVLDHGDGQAGLEVISVVDDHEGRRRRRHCCHDLGSAGGHAVLAGRGVVRKTAFGSRGQAG